MINFKLNNETRVGLLAAVVVAMLLVGLSYLRGSSVLRPSFHLFATYEDLSGLKMGSLVQIRGMSVGQVRGIIYDDQTNLIRVEFDVRNGIRIPSDSRAIIASLDFLGTKAVRVELGQAKTYVQHDDTLASGVDLTVGEVLNREVGPTKVQLDGTLMELRLQIHGLNAVLRKDSLYYRRLFADVAVSMNHLATSSQHLEGILLKADASLRAAQGFLEELERQRGTTGRILTNTADLTDSLKRATAALAPALESTRRALNEVQTLVNGMNAGEGALGKLVKDPTLYNRLDQATNTLNALMTDLKAHPSRYVHVSVFGKKDPLEKLEAKELRQAGRGKSPAADTSAN